MSLPPRTLNGTIDKNQFDVAKIFETYIAFNGDAGRTAVACDIARGEVELLAASEGWSEKIKGWNEIREGSAADVSVQVNRAVNFVQAHRLRTLVDNVVGVLLKKSPDELIGYLTTKRADREGEIHVLGFSSRPITDLVKAAEAAHLMTQRALGDTDAERPEAEASKKGSSIALLVHQAMNAAENLGLDSTQVVKAQLHAPPPSPPSS